jgi:hypothetical protein
VETAAAFPATFVEEAFVGSLGPWGSLEHLWFSIAPPVEFVEHYQLDPFAHPWQFPGSTHEQVAEILTQCGLAGDDVRRLLAKATTDVATQGLSIFATPDVARDLPAAARSKLYLWLAEQNAASWQANAFRFCGQSLEEWFRNAPLAHSTIDLIRPYIYRHGPFLMFADLPAVSVELADRDELVRLVKVLAREVTLLVKLHVRHSENIEPLVRYWGRGGREQEVRPILESLAHFRRGQSIDIVHLLPPFARRLLYTYPRPANDGHDLLRDCHWTSLNFLADHADDSLLNLNVVAQTIARDWRPHAGPPALGDLALFHNDRGSVLHSAVYVADNVFFTKNGPALTRPWMLMTLDHLRHFYPQPAAVNVKFYRRLGT